MSLYKIDGFVLSVDELYTWIAGFVSLHRRGRLRGKKLPRAITDILKREKEDRAATHALLVYVEENEKTLGDIILLTREGMAELAVEKGSSKKA